MLVQGRRTQHMWHQTFHILDFDVPDEELRLRMQSRSEAGTDASEADLAVLEHQLKIQEPLTQSERQTAIAATTLAAVQSLLKAGKP